MLIFTGYARLGVEFICPFTAAILTVQLHQKQSEYSTQRVCKFDLARVLKTIEPLVTVSFSQYIFHHG